MAERPRQPGVPERTPQRVKADVLERQLLEVQRLARIGIWEWDFRRRRATWSPFMWSLHGLEPRDEELTSTQVLAHVVPQDRPRMRALLRAAGKASMTEFDYRITAGTETRLLHARAHVERDSRGRPLRVVGTSQDVTEERHAETLREREFLGAIVESSSDAIVTKDLDGIVTSWNGAAEQLFGYTADEMVGRPVATLFPPELASQETDILARIRRGEKVPYFETQRVRKDGRRVDVSVAISPLRGRDGTIIGASKVARDITERKRQQARERAAMDAEIRRLDEMQRFRARFLNIAAHELKTPLTPIRLQLQLLQIHLKDQPERVQHSLAILTRSVDRLRRLVEDVLDAARVQATQLRMRNEPVDLRDVVAEAVESYAEVARNVGVDLQVRMRAGLVVRGDPTRLVQVANNLISNALKYTPAGGQVEVSLGKHGHDAVLSVADTGRGLTLEQEGLLFQPFTQVHPDLEATTKGSGLGLFIVKAIVEQHGGSISLRSRGEGKGSTATVRLRLADVERTEARPRPPGDSRHARGALRPESWRDIV